MATQAASLSIKNASAYGAVEIKEFIRKHTWQAFIYTISLLLLLWLAWFIPNFILGARMSGAKLIKRAPIQKIILDAPPPSQNDEQAPPPPPDPTINTGPAARAGTPIPVPETQISADLQDFAATDQLARASAAGGTGQDLGGFASNIDFGSKDNKMDVPTEKEPDPDEFIPTDKDADIDINELQKKVEYPEIAKRAGIEGKVVVRVLVGKDGKPVKTRIESSDSEYLEKAAVKAIMSSIFTPAIQGNKAIAEWISIPVNFKLR